MMKTTKQLTSLAVVLMASAALTGCSNELAEVANTEPAKTYQISIPATIDRSAVTRALAGNNASDADVTALTSGWVSTEKVYAYINNAGDAIELTPTNISTDKKTALLTGSITKSGGFADTDKLNLYYQHEKPASDFNFDGQKGTVADISANFDYETAEVTITTGPKADLGDNNILTYSAATFAPQQAITKFTFTLSSTKPAVSKLVITGGGKTWTINPTTAINPIFVAMNNPVATDYSFVATVNGVDLNGSKSVTLQNGKFYTAEISLNKTLTASMVSDIPALTYNGSALTPTITVTDESALTLGTDYTVSYKKGSDAVAAADLKDAGSYTAVITGTGSYEGSVEKSFTVNAADDNAVTFGTTTAVVVSEGAEAVTRTASATYGTVAYASSNTSVATVDASTGEITFVGPGSATITATVAATSNYNAASSTITVYVKQSGISGSLSDPTSGGAW